MSPQLRAQAVLARMDVGQMLTLWCDRVDQGLRLALNKSQGTNGLSWAHWMQAHGFADVELMRTRFEWCLATLNITRPALVVADYAPTMLMAARTLGIPSVETGSAYGLPPSHLDVLPDLLTVAQALTQKAEVVLAEPAEQIALRDSINSALCPLGLPPLQRLAEVYTSDLALPRGVDIWDPYAGARHRPLLLPLERMPPLAGRDATEVFIYLPKLAFKEPALLEALGRLPFPACLVAPDLSAPLAAQIAKSPHLRISNRLLGQAEIVARSRVILCAGQAGTLALAVLAGIPVLALPTHQEQLSNAVRAADKLPACRVLPRKARSADAIIDALAALLNERGLAETARHDALKLRATFPESAIDSYRRLIPPLLGTARMKALFPS